MIKSALWGLVVLAIAVLAAVAFSALARIFICVAIIAVFWTLLCVVLMSTLTPRNNPDRQP